MAVRKTNRKTSQKSSQGAQAVVIFWLVFVIVIIAVFIAQYDTIQRNFNLFRTRITSPSGIEGELEDVPEIEEPSVAPSVEVVVVEPRPQDQRPQEQRPPETQTSTQTPPPQTQTQTTQTQTTQTQTPPSPPPAQTRERTVYFTQIDRDGQILQSRVTRRLPASETPMQDALNAILAGPTAEELNRGILNLIPQNTRILSATVRGSTAYISFSEDFLFNTFGVEGYVAQLRQIVWTVTEFPNVNDVQILVDGRRLDYLGEGIWIGSPINRQSF